jgi:SAM-dependent methyltransferase
VGRRDVGEIVRVAISRGPPGAVAYGEENFGRYLHTVEWALAGAGPPGGALLDVGIYPGHLSAALRDALGVEVTGIGRFVPPRFRDQMAGEGVPVHDVDMERELLPFPEATFDRVLATEILEHLAHPGLFLGECLRVLRPGGTLWLTTPNVADLPNRLRTLRGRSAQSHLFGIPEPFRMTEWVHRREYAPDEVRRLLQAVGFGMVEIHTFTPPSDRSGAWRMAARLVNLVPGLGGTIFAAARRPTGLPPGAPGEAPVDRARVTTDREYVEAEPGGPGSLRVEASNIGTTHWTTGGTAGGTIGGQGPVLLGMHLLDVQGRALERDFARQGLPGVVGPGQAVAVDFPFVAPAEPGVYLVEIDLVREGHRWFGDDFPSTARAVLRVGRAASVER